MMQTRWRDGQSLTDDDKSAGPAARENSMHVPGRACKRSHLFVKLFSAMGKGYIKKREVNEDAYVEEMTISCKAENIVVKG